MSKLLIAEPPLQVLRSLAVKVGLNEAIVLQQVHYLSLRNAGWVEKSIREWHEDDFPFWGEATVKRAFTNLRQGGLIIDEKAAKGMDQTRRYRVDYDALEQLLPSDQSDPMHRINVSRSTGSDRANASGQSDPVSNREQRSTTDPPKPPKGQRVRDLAAHKDECATYAALHFPELGADGTDAVSQAVRDGNATHADVTTFIDRWWRRGSEG